MTARLAALCALIDKTPSFIDVGCDHGFVVQYVYAHRLADTITACDISAPSLDKAKKLLGEDGGVRFVCADGAVAAAGHDTVLVSGMGGKEILSVMRGCAPRTFILSPQSHVREVREELLRRDYDIVFDRVVRCGKKFYDCIKATRGGGNARLAQAKAVQLAYGMFLHEKNDALLEKLHTLEKAFASYPPTEENERTRAEIKEAIQWQLR